MTAFGNLLKEWRKIRRFSQLQLALEADVSARHISFLESGRANPSKAMVMRLTQALAMPRPAANQAFHSAGFAPAYPDIPAGARAIAPINKAMEMVLAGHDPFPGVAVDRHWNIIAANRGASMLLSLLPSNTEPNMIALLIAAADSKLIENWEEVATLSLIRLRSEINDLGGDPALSVIAERLAGHRRVAAVELGNIRYDKAVIPSIFCFDDIRLSLFSMIAQFGSVQDIRAGELRIELMFPTDDATESWFLAPAALPR